MSDVPSWIRARASASVDSLVAAVLAVVVTKVLSTDATPGVSGPSGGKGEALGVQVLRWGLPIAASIGVYWLGRWRGARGVEPRGEAIDARVLFRSAEHWPDVVGKPNWLDRLDPANATNEMGRGAIQKSGRRLLIRRDNTVNRFEALLQTGYLDQPTSRGQYVEKDATVSGRRWLRVSFRAQALTGSQVIQIIAQRTHSLDNSYLRQSRKITVGPTEQREVVEFDLELNDHFYLHIDSVGASEVGAEIALWDFLVEDTSDRSP